MKMKVTIDLNDVLTVSLCFTVVQVLNGIVFYIPWAEIFAAVYWIWAMSFALLLVTWRQMKSIDDVIAALKMRSADDQVAIMRALAEDNGYVVVAGYSITGEEPVLERLAHEIESYRLGLAYISLNPGCDAQTIAGQTLDVNNEQKVGD